MGQWSAVRRGLAAGRGLGRWRKPQAAAAVVGRLRSGAWPARRVGPAAVAGGLLLAAAVLGYWTPLLAQEGGVGIAFDDLTSHPTHTTVDGFGVALANLNAATTYEVVVSTDNAAALGLGACGTASQSATVTGATAHDLAFVVYACTLGSGTLTAEVRPSGAATPAASVSQALTVLAIPEGSPPGVPGAAAAAAASGGATRAGTPGIVPSVGFDNVTTSSARATWGKPSDGDNPLTGFGLLFWTGPQHPDYGDAFVVGAASRSHTYTGLQAGATYKFRIHACNGEDSCGWWTHPPKEVRIPTPAATPTPTATAAPTAAPTAKPAPGAPGAVRHLTHSGSGHQTVAIGWTAPSSDGGRALTGYQVQHREQGAPDWPEGSDVVPGAGATAWTIRGLINGTIYEVQVRACNAAPLCGDWTPLPAPVAAGNKVGSATLIPSAADITIGQRQKFEIHDIPVGKTAHVRMYGSIQPAGQCPDRSAAQAQARGPSTGPGYYDSVWIEGCADGGTGWLRVVNADDTELYARATITVQPADTTPDPAPAPGQPPSPGPGEPTPIDECGSIAPGALAKPRVLDVIPQSQRRALLTWVGTTGAAHYNVEVSEVGGTGSEIARVTDPCYKIFLDRVLSFPARGLQNARAFQLQVKASDGNRELASETITIIDTPITSANGYTAGSQRAEISWTPIKDKNFLNNNSYAGGTYELRYRALSGDHTELLWRPDNFDDFLPPRSNASSPQIIDSLSSGRVYAVQLIYREDPGTSADTEVFAARDAYVWPSLSSAIAAGSESAARIAGFPMQLPLPSTTYEYRICADTFPKGPSSNPDEIRNKWKALIQHAFEQWEVSTDGLVTMNYNSNDCTDYTPLIRRIIRFIDNYSGTDLAADVVGLVMSLQLNTSLITALDSRINEVIMFDDRDATRSDRYLLNLNFTTPFNRHPRPDEIQRQFSEIAAAFGQTWCWDGSAIACAAPSRIRGGTEVGYTTDIFLLRSKVEHDPLTLPGGDANVDRSDIAFNTCPSVTPPYSVYGVLVHEAGHALGIRGGSGHPRFSDSAMTAEVTERNCSPHPMDVLAMYALYQSR